MRFTYEGAQLTQEKVADVTEWDGILYHKIKSSAKDDGVDRQSECFSTDEHGLFRFDKEKFKTRLDRHQKMKREHGGILFNGILSNEVTFTEYFERNEKTGLPIRIFYAQAPMFLDRDVVGYCGRYTGKTWCIKWNGLHRAVNFRGSQLLVWSHDEAHVEPRFQDIYNPIDNHPFFKQLLKRKAGAVSKTSPYKIEFANRFTWHGVFPGNMGRNLEQYHTDGHLCDECLPYDSRVTLSNGQEFQIGDIVEKRQEGEVLSYNPSTGNIEPKRIIGWHKVPLRGRRLLSIGGMTATEDHPVFTKEHGYVSIADYTENLFYMSDHVLQLDYDDSYKLKQVNPLTTIPSCRIATWRRIDQLERKSAWERPDYLSTRGGAVGISPVEISGAEGVDTNSPDWPSLHGMGWSDLLFQYVNSSSVYRDRCNFVPRRCSWAKAHYRRHTVFSGRKSLQRLVHGRRFYGKTQRGTQHLQFSSNGFGKSRRSPKKMGDRFLCISLKKRSGNSVQERGSTRGSEIDSTLLGSLSCLQRGDGRARRYRSIRSTRNDCWKRKLSDMRGVDTEKQVQNYLRFRGMSEGTEKRSKRQARCKGKVKKPTPYSVMPYMREGKPQSQIRNSETVLGGMQKGERKALSVQTKRNDKGIKAGARILRSLRKLRIDREKKSLGQDVRRCQLSERGIQAGEAYVYCIDVEDNHNFFANGILVKNCQEIGKLDFEKFLPTQNPPNNLFGYISKFFGVNSQGYRDRPFYELTFKDPHYSEHVYTVPSWNNIIYDLSTHAKWLNSYGGNVEAAKFKQMVRGQISEKTEGVFSSRHYENCVEIGRRLASEVYGIEKLPFQKKEFTGESFERVRYDYGRLIGAPLNLPDYSDIRIGMDHGTGGGLTIIEVYVKVINPWNKDLWHVAHRFVLSRVETQYQAGFLDHLMRNVEGNEGIYPTISYAGIDVTGNLNVWGYLTDEKDDRYNNPRNNYKERLVGISFSDRIPATVCEEKPEGVVSKKGKLDTGEEVYYVMQEMSPFTTELIARRMADGGYSLPDTQSEDPKRFSEFMNIVFDGKKFHTFPRDNDHTIAANRCFEATVHLKNTVNEIEMGILREKMNLYNQSGGFVTTFTFPGF